jgi:hypothetical protein
MSSIIQLLDKQIKLTREEEYLGKQKTSFWASEGKLMAFDIFHRWMGTPPTNVMSEEKIMMLRMRKLTEEAVVELIRKSGNLIEKLSNNERCYFEWGPHKIPISGYPDLGLVIDEEQIITEVKTYYGGLQHSQIKNGTVKQEYLIQLAIYMYYFKIRHGILLMINQGTGERFEFELFQQDNPYHFLCPDNGDEIDLEAVFKRWEKIYIENILPKKEPEIEYIYKYPIEKIDWATIAKSKIASARSGKVVIGDYQVKYSDFKNMIVERQGTVLGYTDKELALIRKLTDGYTKKTNQVRFDPKELN